MMKSIKRMILTGAAVMVMMSFAAPAMANDYAPQVSGDLALSYPEPPVNVKSPGLDQVVAPSLSYPPKPIKGTPPH